MSDTPNKEQTSKIEVEEEEEEQSGGILLWLLLGILLVMLLGGGLAIASYLGLLSFGDLTNKARQLPQQITQQIPVVTKYFASKATVDQTENAENETMNTGIPDVPPLLPAQQPIPLVKPVLPAETPEAIAKAKAEEAKNISRLARLYGNMKPEEAAPIMRELDDDLVVNLLKKMEDEQAAKILAVMEPQRAAKVTKLLAGKPKIIVQVN